MAPKTSSKPKGKAHKKKVRDPLDHSLPLYIRRAMEAADLDFLNRCPPAPNAPGAIGLGLAILGQYSDFIEVDPGRGHGQVILAGPVDVQVSVSHRKVLQDIGWHHNPAEYAGWVFYL